LRHVRLTTSLLIAPLKTAFSARRTRRLFVPARQYRARHRSDNELPNTGPSGLRQTIIDLIAKRAALDMEELALRADSAYTSG
jgi:hypothetical protein